MIKIYQFLLGFYLTNVAFSAVCHGGGVVDPSGKFCYIIGNKYLTFSSAEQACYQYGGYHLAVINNMVDNNFISKLARSHGYENLFIGATDITSDGSWQWVDGSKMGFMNWAAAPKLGSCAMLRTSDGRWIRDDCETKQSFICYGRAVGGPTDKPTTTEEPTVPAPFREGQFLMFIGDSESLGDPNNHTDIAAYYTKERDFIMAVADHLWEFNFYYDENLICSVWADQSWYGWANFQQQFTDGYSESQRSQFNNDILKLNFTEFTYQMNNISTAITALQDFHWYPAPTDFGYTVLVFFTANQDFTGVPSLFDPIPFAVDEILVVQMNGSQMPIPSNNSKVSKVSISNNFDASDVQTVTNALKCH